VADIQAFDGLARNYDRFRPGYPPRLLSTLASYVRESHDQSTSLIVDVGAGTGISTRAIAASLDSHFRFLGVEPNAAMRKMAAAHSSSGAVDYVDGTAEKLPIRDASATAVCAAQALQWFDRGAFYAEALRVLRENGTLAVLQNNRRWQDSEFLARYEEFLEECSPGYDRHYRTFDIAEELQSIPSVSDLLVDKELWSREMSLDDFLGMSLSSSKTKAAVQTMGEARVRARVRALAEREGASVSIPYVAELFLVRKVDQL
jgi:ubiquinone/menaquinone biosynthesis C-methylase UbiE